ncbi:MAG TPA: hypothetical protein VN700_19820 [Vicinamibacterales bacterium]|nr:hypothetical protein [Vicinamibacterales bacterium]
MNQDAHDPIDAIVQLRDELGRVTVSRNFAERVRERLADELEPLRAELADVAVSPEFAVRVRERVEEIRRPYWGFNWRLAMPFAAGLAATIAAVVMWPRQATEPVSPAATVASVAPSGGSQEAGSSDPARPPVAPLVVTSSTPRVAPRRVSPALQTIAAKSDPFLEVLTDQPELLRRLHVGIDRSDVAVDSTESTALFEVPVLEVPKVEVSPISLFVVPNPRLPLGVSPMILRIAAEAAERSSK